MKSENQVVLEFPSRSSNEAFARVAAAGVALELGPPPGGGRARETAVSEAVTNAIVHGYPENFGRIVIKLRLREGNILEIVVKDWGVGIADVEQARKPMFTTGNDERSGMGFTIMESFMDTLRVRSAPQKGTTVTMRKRISTRVGDRK